VRGGIQNMHSSVLATSTSELVYSLRSSTITTHCCIYEVLQRMNGTNRRHNAVNRSLFID